MKNREAPQMAVQLDLALVPADAVTRPDRSIQERFEAYHKKHPDVYAALAMFARDATQRGRQRFGIRLLWERVRWYMTIERDQGEEFKLNDHYHSRYARLLMEREKDLAGLFSVRKLKS